MSQPSPTTLTDRVRTLANGILSKIGSSLHHLGVHPDWITTAGLLIVCVSGVFIAQGQFFTAGIILLLGLPLDALDGAVARAMNRQDAFGAVLDSTLDRYADGVIFAALGYYFAVHDRFEMLLLSMAAMLGSFLVSYVRARADDSKVAVTVKVGLFTRLERLIVILVALLVPDLVNYAPLLDVCLVILAIGTNITALHRLWYVYRALQQRQNQDYDD